MESSKGYTASGDDGDLTESLVLQLWPRHSIELVPLPVTVATDSRLDKSRVVR